MAGSIRGHRPAPYFHMYSHTGPRVKTQKHLYWSIVCTMAQVTSTCTTNTDILQYILYVDDGKATSIQHTTRTCPN